MAFKYALMDDKLYCRTVDGIILKCLVEDQARVVMGDVLESIWDIHQSLR
jgi:hypothetical protein